MTQKNRKNKRILLTLLKVALWTLMTAVLLIVGSSLCAVKMLRPEVLTHFANRMANSSLNADVRIARVALSLQKSYPMLRLDIDSVTVVSRSLTVDSLTAIAHPAWADTLASFSHLSGEVNVLSLARGMIDLGDFELRRPGINLFILNDSVNNYSIFKPTATEPDITTASFPKVKLRSFRLVDPQPLRFLNVADSVAVTATFETFSISSERQSQQPAYSLNFASNIDSPLFDFFNLQRLPVSFTGDMLWQPEDPYVFSLDKFKYAVSVLSGELSTTIDINNELLLKSFHLSVAPLNVSDILAAVPAEWARQYSIPSDIRTDARIGLEATLNEPYDLSQEGLPRATVAVEIPQCSFRSGKIDLRSFELKAVVDTKGPALNDAVVDIERLLVQGPATGFTASCRLSDLTTDMLFDGRLDGKIDLEKLPQIIKNLIPGSIVGVVRADATIKGRPSMFRPNTFYRLHAGGNLVLDQVRYESADTSLAAEVGHARIHLGTSESFQGARRKVDSLLSVKLTVDTATIVKDDVLMRLRDLTVGAAVSNRSSSSDTTSITPLGGRISVGMFSVFALTDSAGMRLRNLDGSLAMVPLKADPAMPRLIGRLNIGRISVGDNFTRFMISKSNLLVHANPKAEPRAIKRRKEIKRIADSIAAAHPSLPLDSIYELALEHRRRHRGRHRVHLEQDSLDLEVIDWGTSKSLARFLTEWDLGGTLTASRARLFTSAFPVRNRVRNFNVEFNTDTVTLDNVQYKAGHSDFLISGRISNIRRALTSRQKKQSLKVEFDMLSDTIDVNELANAFFTGAGKRKIELAPGSFDDENELDNSIKLSSDGTESRGPLLVPTNIEAELRLKANNVLYSELLLHDLRGSVLAYDGALNLHDLTASSDVGSVDLSALYSAPYADNMQFGFGLKLNKFNIAQFLKLVPVVDSMMPLMRDFSGVVSANIAATAPIDKQMNIALPELRAAINISGEQLKVIDPETFKTMAKWLFFKDKQKNEIDRMSAEMVVQDGRFEVFPFFFDFDRYRIGVQGSNDLALNLDYHIAVLKSPLPFKFGINIKGNIDDMKIRLGRARFNEKTGVRKVAIVDTTRVNLLRQIENVFRRGVRNSRFAPINISQHPEASTINLAEDTLSHADSLYLIKEGLIPSNLNVAPEPASGKKKR